jgi:uncharacterized MnhB-related membrane protein
MMYEISWIFDGVLALTLIGLAWRLLSITDLFKAIVLFIAFGLLMALTWVRLEAVDIALAEAAIGAGLTGALFLTTLRHLDSQDCPGAKPGQGETTEYHADRS